MKTEQWVGIMVGDTVGSVESTEGAMTNLEQDGVFYTKTVQLNMSGGAKLFGCTWDDCRFVASTAVGVAIGHHRIHTPKDPDSPESRRRPVSPKKGAALAQYSDWTLTEITGRLSDLESDWEVLTKRHDAQVERLTTGRLEAQRQVQELKARIKGLEKELADLKVAGQRFFAAVGK